MAITRRQFIKRGGLVTAGSLLGPSLFNRLLLRRALAAIETRYFVVIFNDGGNDGLNTLTPMTDGGATLRAAYDAARSNINVAPGVLLPIGNDVTGAQVGLHPGLQGLKDIFDGGDLAVIQGCGYPEYSLSHEQSRVIWQTADPLGTGYGLGTGWVGRYLADNYAGSDIPAVNIANAVVGEFRQTATSVLTVDQLENFGFPYDYYYPADVALKRQAFLDLCATAGASAQSTIQYIGDSGVATLLSSESYPPLHAQYVADRPAQNDAYDAVGRSLARDLREVAKVIWGVENGAANVNARFFQVSNGGYDTHSDQGGATGQHYNLHRELGDSVKAFYDDLATMPGNVLDRTCILVWSEFSRRIPQNDNGTDHGSQGPMFMIGGSVSGGIYGKHPNINQIDLDDEGNTVYRQGAAATAFRSTDFRDVYGTVFKRWLELTQSEVATLLPPDAGDANFYWVTPNFDIGFLPPVPPG